MNILTVKWWSVALLFTLSVVLSACSPTGSEPTPVAPAKITRLEGLPERPATVRLIMLGEDYPQIDDVSKALGTATGLPGSVHRQFLEMPQAAYDAKRDQWDVSKLLENLRQVEFPGHQLSLVITQRDIFPGTDSDLAYCFYSGNAKVTVISTHRLVSFDGDEDINPGLTFNRLMKLILRVVLLQGYGLPLSDDSRSLLYKNSQGLPRLDAMEFKI